MPKRIQKEKPKPQEREEPSETPKATKTTPPSTEDFDALLDEIDSVLEENAQEFVNNYVQKGGE